MKSRNHWKRLLAAAVVLCMMLALAPGALAAEPGPMIRSAEPEARETGRIGIEEAKAILAEARTKAGLIAGDASAVDADATIRVIVELESAPACAAVGSVAWSAASKSAEAQVMLAQSSVSDKAEAITGTKVINRSAYLVNTFTIKAKASQLAALAALPGVKSVSPVTTFELKMSHAIDMTTATKLWDEMGYKGEGMLIAVVDTGVNYAHPDMVLDEGVEVKMTEADAEAKIAELGYGAYYTEKVPFAYSYVNFGEIDNSRSTHGLHVSGIASGNGEVTGVAPNAQVLGLQVFGDGNSAYLDDIIRAVEDAVKLDADVINLSLGSTAGFYDDVEHLQAALEAATAAGVLCCVSAGNDGTSASLMGLNVNDFGVIDTGAVSSPATAPSALAVASVQNDYILGNILSLTDSDGNTYSGLAKNFSDIYAEQHMSDPERTDWALIQDAVLVDCGLGTSEEMNSMDMIMKVLMGYRMNGIPWVGLVSRGENSFEEKIQNVMGLGASGIIIYNNEDSDNVPFNVSAGDAAQRYSWRYALFVSGNFGKELLELAETVTVSFHSLEEEYFLAPDGGQMSTFSSWGPTPTLDIKPEISAPGGNIYSISSGDGYEFMSGTSMAAPYVSGSAVLALQAVKDAIDEGTLKLGDLSPAAFVKMSLMNTADPILDADGLPFSVRQQGAGMVDPAGAAANKVLATVNGLADAALGSIDGSTSFEIVLTNYGVEDMTYAPSGSVVLSDLTLDDGTYTVQATDGVFSFDVKTITVPAGGSAVLTATLDPTGVENDHFAEGFVTLRCEGGGETIGLPVLAFYGDWYAAQNIFDAPTWDEDNIIGALCGWPSTMVSADGYIAGYNSHQEFVPENISFSPDGDGSMEVVYPLLGMLRSAERINVEVTDENGNVLRLIQTVTQVPKNLGVDANGIYKQTYARLADYDVGAGMWDGTVYDPSTGEFVACPEGQYYLRATAVMPGSELEEVIELPVKLDVTAPELEIRDVVYSPDDGIVTVTFYARDNVDVFDAFLVLINGEEFQIDRTECDYDEESFIYVVQISGATYYESPLNEIGVYVEDYANLGALQYRYFDADETLPVIFSTLHNEEDSWYDNFLLIEDFAEKTDRLTAEALKTAEFDYEIRGVVSAEVATLTINDHEVEIHEDRSFLDPVKIKYKENEFHVVAAAEDGTVLMDVVRLLYNSSGSALSLRFYPAVYLEGEEAFREMVPATRRPAEQWTMQTPYGRTYRQAFGYNTMYQETVPMAIEADDKVLEVRMFYFDPAYENTADSFDMSFTMPPLPDQHYVDEIIITPDAFEYDEEREVYLAFFDLPMAPRASGYEVDDPTLTDTRYNECYITTIDVLGQPTYSMVSVGNRDLTVIEQNSEWGLTDYNILEDPDSISVSAVGFNIHPMVEVLEEYGVFVFTPDDLDENGYLHLEGETVGPKADTVTIYFDGQDVMDPDDPTKFSFDYKMFPGVNYMTLYEENQGWTLSYTFLMYYLPEPTQLTFDDEHIRDGMCLIVYKDSFDVSGTLRSYYVGSVVDVNGDNAFYMEGPLSTSDGEAIEQHFSYTVPLQKGENVITVSVKDITGLAEEIRFSVIWTDKPTVPEPVTPVQPSTDDDQPPEEDDQPPRTLFDDIQDESAFYYDAVYWAVDNGVTTGKTETTFAPVDECTRAQIVTFLYRAAGEPEVAESECPFTDVVAGSYYERAVMWAVANGITTGTTETTFSPDAVCTRAQIVTFLWRAMGRPDAPAAAFSDVPEDAYYAGAVAWAVANGITKGLEADVFGPDANCTRGQAVTFLYRAYK